MGGLGVFLYFYLHLRSGGVVIFAHMIWERHTQ